MKKTQEGFWRRRALEFQLWFLSGIVRSSFVKHFFSAVHLLNPSCAQRSPSSSCPYPCLCSDNLLTLVKFTRLQSHNEERPVHRLWLCWHSNSGHGETDQKEKRRKRPREDLTWFDNLTFLSQAQKDQQAVPCSWDVLPVFHIIIPAINSWHFLTF